MSLKDYSPKTVEVYNPRLRKVVVYIKASFIPAGALAIFTSLQAIDQMCEEKVDSLNQYRFID